MKGLLRGLLVIGLIVVGYGALAVYVPAVRIAPVCAPAEAFLINHGLIKVGSADWGYLKLRAGKEGIETLKALKRNGASDDIRITADAVLKGYKGTRDMCDDAPCAKESDIREFKPRLRALELKTELLPGQTLPHDFVVDTANDQDLDCASPAARAMGRSACILRMQDFNGDAKNEVYLEILRNDETGAESEIRSIHIYRKADQGWVTGPRLDFAHFDAKLNPQRPFVLEPAPLDTMVINGSAFRFSTLSSDPTLPIGKFLSPDAFSHLPGCTDMAHCRGIVINLDHRSYEDVIMITDPAPSNVYIPFSATYFHNDSQGIHVGGHANICKELVPDLAHATVTFTRPTWKMIRLGKNTYPSGGNPWCRTAGQIQ